MKIIVRMLPKGYSDLYETATFDSKVNIWKDGKTATYTKHH